MRRVAPAPLELVIPEGLSEAATVELLAKRLELRPQPARRERRVLLDTFDGRLRAAGLRAELAAGRTLTLIEPDAPARAAEVAKAPRYLTGELPPGPVRDRLAGVLEERALLPLATLSRRIQPLPVVNEDGKTVVRMEAEHADGLESRLHVRPVLGYDRDFERTARTLTGKLGLAAAETALFDLAVRAAGGRPEGVSAKVGVKPHPATRTDVAAGAMLARLHEIATANVQGTLDDLDPEFLHDLRVAVRRARSLLRELKGVHAPRERDHLREELKWIQQFTGPARDLDVQLHEWPELTSGLREQRGADLAPLHDLLQRRRAAALKGLRAGLRSERFAAAMDAWRDLATAPPARKDDEDRPLAREPIERVAAERIDTVYRRMVRDGREIDHGSHDEMLHDLRKRGKELRYLLELFGGIFPTSVVKPMVTSLKGLQDVLGRFQDRSIQTESLRELGSELAGARGGPAALMALGLVIEALERDQLQARGEFHERFEAFASKEQRRLVKATFS